MYSALWHLSLKAFVTDTQLQSLEYLVYLNQRSPPTTMKFTNVLLTLSLLFFCARAANPQPKTVELALMSSVGNLDGSEYYVNFTVGTPGQLQTVLIDTGSSNTFVFAPNASFCKTSGCDGGTFDLSKSSTYEKVNTTKGFFTSFMMGSNWFRGDYVRDVVQMSMQRSFEAKCQSFISRVYTNTFFRRLGDLKTSIRTCS
jgi:hypothetical protein